MHAGSWAQLVVPNQQQILGIASNPIPPGGGGQSCQFANLMPWNPSSKSIDMMIADHYGTGDNMQLTRYLEASNAFEQTLPPGHTGVTGIGHGYNHLACNPRTGELFHHKFNGNQNFRKTLTDSAFKSFGGDAATHQVAEACTWWTGAFNGAGAQGAYLVYASGIKPGQMSAWDPLSQEWFWNGAVVTPNNGDTYHTVMQYSAPRNCAVFGGGNNANRKLWRLNSDHTITNMPDPPVGVGVTIGNFNVDPISGNFLLLGQGQLWELNPSGAGTWTQQTGNRAPPSGVGVPTAANTGVISSSLHEHGVLAYITVVSMGSPCSFFLYKHAGQQRHRHGSSASSAL